MVIHTYTWFIKNMSKPESTLKKKSNSVCYLNVHESVAMDKTLMMDPELENTTDLMAKILSGGKC